MAPVCLKVILLGTFTVIVNQNTVINARLHFWTSVKCSMSLFLESKTGKFCDCSFFCLTSYWLLWKLLFFLFFFLFVSEGKETITVIFLTDVRYSVLSFWWYQREMLFWKFGCWFLNFKNDFGNIVIFIPNFCIKSITTKVIEKM